MEMKSWNSSIRFIGRCIKHYIEIKLEMVRTKKMYKVDESQ